MDLFRRKSPAVALRGVHFDLKGAPPTAKRLGELIELAAGLKANCALMEWEDTYPWQRFPELRKPWAYSKKQVTAVLDRAEAAGIAPIPLVQCFGHMENVLNKPRFAHLREEADLPQEICPLHPEAQGLILALVDEVLETHGGRITHFHLGGDETWTLGSCPRCKRYVKKHGKESLYRQHVEPMLDHLLAQGIRPILWDDMMRDWPMADLRRLAKKADLMVWSYEPDIHIQVKARVLDRYQKAGLKLWGASAYRGGDGVGSVRDCPKLTDRAANCLAWTKEAKARSFEGVMATGWARFTSSMIQCGTMEASLETLVLACAAAWDAALPKDRQRAARAWLTRGKGAKLAGAKVTRCREAAEALHAWRETMVASIAWADHHAMFNDEPGRHHDRYACPKGLDDLLDEGRKVAKRFVAAHRGLVQPACLDYYVKSRLIPLERRVRALPLV